MSGKSIAPNTEILDLIYDDIEAKTGLKLTRNPLRHVTIYDDGNDGNQYAINLHTYEIRDGVFATPLNDRADLVEIRSLKPLQSCAPTIYYLR